MTIRTLTDQQLTCVDWLLEHGLGASARAHICDARGKSANVRIARSKTLRPQARIHLLVTSSDGARGWALPADVSFATPRNSECNAQEALRRAAELVEGHLRLTVRRVIRLASEDHWQLEGASLGLGAALAYVSKASGRQPPYPVFATGRLATNGGVAPVDHTTRKVEAALVELGDSDGRVLVPVEAGVLVEDRRVVPVDTLGSAIEAAFGGAVDSAAPFFDSFRTWLSGLAQRSSTEALGQLDAMQDSPLAEADRALVLMHRGNHLRHLGRTSEAAECHARAVEIARSQSLKSHSRVELENELQNTLLDFFDFDGPIKWFEERVALDLGSVQDELSARGSLARAYGLAGRAAEAVRARRALLPLHKISELRKDLPHSLAELALVAGLASDALVFEEAETLIVSQEPSYRTEWQPVWDTHSIVRGHVLLGHDELVARWYEGAEQLPGAQPFSGAIGGRSSHERAGHPLCSTVRAVTRALRRSGRGGASRELAESVATDGEGLVGWVAGLGRLELALTLRGLALHDRAEQVRRETREELLRCSPHASRYHHALLDGDWDAMDQELCRVFY